MSGNDLCWKSATELARLVRAKKVSPVELVDACLARIAEVNPRVNAYCTVAAERARLDAAAAEARVQRGEPLGPLHGVPFSVKDLTPTKGIRTTMGSKIFEAYVPEEDAILVDRLRRAGGILIGKTNTPEFGCKPFTDNRIFGATHNPWALDRSAGGSSGGAAAAVAAGLGPLAEGSDLGGSIRHPASWCGVVGLKPGQGRIARYPNATSWNVMSSNGPITRTVADAGLMFAAMVGPDPRDPLALPDTGEDWGAVAAPGDVSPLRLAWSSDLGGAAPVDPAVASICRRAAERFSDLRWPLEEASPEIGEIRTPFLALNATLRQATAGRYLDRWREQMDPILVRRIELSRSVTPLEIGQAEVERSAYHQRLRRFFERYDLLLCPATAIPASPLAAPLPPEIAGRAIREHLDMMVLTYAFNLSPYPAITVPAGSTDEGLPVGLQIVGGWRREAVVLQAAAAFEQMVPWTGRRPALR